MATCMQHWILLLLTLSQVLALPELGVWRVKYDEETISHAFSKSVFAGTMISVAISCEGDKPVKLDVSWVIRLSPCAQEYDGIEDEQERQAGYLLKPEFFFAKDVDIKQVEFLKNRTIITCGGNDKNPFLDDHTKDKPHVEDAIIPVIENQTVQDPGSGNKKATEAPKSGNRRKRQADQTPKAPTKKPTTKAPPPKATTAATVVTTTIAPSKLPQEIDHSHLAKFWRDGYYVFVLELKPQQKEQKFTADVIVRMPGPHGYISAVEFPLEIFYGLMGLVYIVYGIVWLVLLGCNWRDLLRVQFWIEGVIVLGLLEKTVFFAEYESLSKTGESVRGGVIFAELVSSMKRALARMLVIVVSLGFGIVKPRLGQTFHKVLCVGVMYFVLGSIEGCLRALKPKSDQSNELMLAAVPLAVLDAVICWWIFSSLVQTTRTLRLRRNIVKLSLYRHFTNTLIFAVLASIAYMIWSITQHKLKTCITDWRELWVDEAFWHLLFSVILLIIMILWRPTANNQRYAFSPLLDAAEEEDDDTVMNDAFDGMKMRGKHLSNGSPKQKEGRKSVEDDLKWVEENIPSSISDKALPSLLDSDEELQNTHFEISKME